MPALLSLETPMEHFLRTEDFHPDRAAVRLALYWKHRKHIFGDRWLLPLTQSGRGALTSVEIQLFRQGFFLYVPSPTMPILIIDWSQVERLGATSRNVERLAMYTFTVISKDLATQTKGITVTHFLMASDQGGTRRANAVSVFLPDLWNWIKKAWPVKLCRFKIVQAHDQNRSDHLSDFLRFRVARTIAYNCSGMVPEEIRGKSVMDVRRQLQIAGFNRETAPVQLGGD